VVRFEEGTLQACHRSERKRFSSVKSFDKYVYAGSRNCFDFDYASRIEFANSMGLCPSALDGSRDTGNRDNPGVGKTRNFPHIPARRSKSPSKRLRRGRSIVGTGCSPEFAWSGVIRDIASGGPNRTNEQKRTVVSMHPANFSEV